MRGETTGRERSLTGERRGGEVESTQKEKDYIIDSLRVWPCLQCDVMAASRGADASRIHGRKA